MQDDALEALLMRRAPALAALTSELIAALREMRPDFTMKVATGWGTVNFHHPGAGFLVAVYPARDHVSLIFQDGRLLDSPLLEDDGKVRRVRWIPLQPGAPIPFDEIGILLAEAVALRS